MWTNAITINIRSRDDVRLSAAGLARARRRRGAAVGGLAEHEREMISQRSAAALAAARARGKKLGTYSKVLARQNSAAAVAARDAKLEPVLRELTHLSSRVAAAEIERRGLGSVSYRTVARARVRLGLQTAR